MRCQLDIPHGHTTSPPDGDCLQYGGATFALATATIHKLRSSKRRRERYAAPLLNPRGVFALAAMLYQLPVAQVVLTNAPPGRAIRDYLNERHGGIPVNRIAQGVLPLPSTLAEYLVGRSRQAVRTNIRHARSLGIGCRPVPVSEQPEMFELWLTRWAPHVAPHVSAEQFTKGVPRHVQWWVATQRSGTPLALGLLSIDEDWALLHTMVSKSHPARWLLHTHLVGELCDRGVGNLLVHGSDALRMSPQLQYFQRLLGYRVTHLACPSADAASTIVTRRRSSVTPGRTAILR